MCIFSGPVEDVSKTKIYCRVKDDKQTLVYSMDVSFNDSVAMILPIPTKSRKEDAVEFINLKEKANFFKELDKPFEVRSRGMSKGLGADSFSLKVHEVGDFIASFVPHRLFFNRLDESFRLSENVWDNLPQYNDAGFVVFQLKNEGHYHPMGFVFPTRTPDKVFFPTVHVHDGHVPERGDFDHSLYFQFEGTPKTEGLPQLTQRSHDLAKNYIKSDLVDPDMYIYKRQIFGLKENKDIYVN